MSRSGQGGRDSGERARAAERLARLVPRCPCKGCAKDARCERGVTCKEYREWFTACWRDLQVIFGRRTGRARQQQEDGGRHELQNIQGGAKDHPGGDGAADTETL